MAGDNTHVLKLCIMLYLRSFFSREQPIKIRFHDVDMRNESSYYIWIDLGLSLNTEHRTRNTSEGITKLVIIADTC